ncbi:MAG: transposase [Flavobacteriales bacterium Tduv]
MIHWEVDGERNKKNISKRTGNKRSTAYSGISLFTMILLSHCYDLRDVGTEELLTKSLIFMRFCGFRLKDQIPDHTTLFRFRNEIVAKKEYDAY